MNKISRDDHLERGRLFDAPAGSASPLAVLWRRRLTVSLITLACVVIGGLYVLVATPIFSASAKVLVEQNEQEALGQKDAAPQSEYYVETQADVFQSGPVLKRALDAVHYRNLKTFGQAGEDPVAWLRRSGALKVDVAKKSDVIVVSMESPWAEEAAAFANSVVKEYIAEQAQRKHSVGSQMIDSLKNEREDLKRRRDESMDAMQKFKRENGVLSFGTDRGNTAMERNAVLAASQTTAEMAVIQLRAQLAATKRALADPRTLSAFVEAQQFKARDAGDHEYDELRSQLVSQMLALSTISVSEGDGNVHVQNMLSLVAASRARVAEKEHAIAEAHLVSVMTQLAEAEESERELRKAMDAERTQILALGPQAMEYSKLEADVARIQKQCDILDGRMAELSVNELGGLPLNVQLLEPARADARPVKPNALLILAAAFMAGGMIGIGVALLQEWRDARFRSPEEIMSVLGTSVIATVPRMNSRLSPTARGQILCLETHSPSAEAYRSARTSLHLGVSREAKTILLASAIPGEGKSTTASNLAIALAQGGHRTLLIDCDMRDPVQHLIFEADGSVGISKVIAGEVKLAAAIQQTAVHGLYLLPSGPTPPNPSELLAGQRFGRLMQALLATFDRIVIDSPPLTVADDARIIAASANATLLVLRMNHSTHRAVSHAIEELQKVGANVLGAVANDTPSSRVHSYYRGSWQYASSAKRILASIKDRRNGSETPQPRNLAVDDSLSVTEPNWSDGSDARVIRVGGEW